MSITFTEANAIRSDIESTATRHLTNIRSSLDHIQTLTTAIAALSNRSDVARVLGYLNTLDLTDPANAHWARFNEEVSIMLTEQATILSALSQINNSISTLRNNTGII